MVACTPAAVRTWRGGSPPALGWLRGCAAGQPEVTAASMLGHHASLLSSYLEGLSEGDSAMDSADQRIYYRGQGFDNAPAPGFVDPVVVITKSRTALHWIATSLDIHEDAEHGDSHLSPDAEFNHGSPETAASFKILSPALRPPVT